MQTQNLACFHKFNKIYIFGTNRAFRSAATRRPAHSRLQVRSMRAVVQRVKSASVTVDDKIISRIGPGLLCLVGLKDGDTADDAEFICRRILNARLWHATEGNKSWDQSLVQKEYEVLLVSQFTLFGLMKGNKPDFHLAMPPSQAQEAYSKFVGLVRSKYVADRVKDGKFGAMMDVQLVNDMFFIAREDFTGQYEDAKKTHLISVARWPG